MSRRELLEEACERCLKEFYKYVYPRVSWKNFIKECKEYSEKHKAWKQYTEVKHEKDKNPEKWIKMKALFPDWREDASITECIGPKPYEFYYLPKDILNDIVESYINAYKLDDHQNLLDIIQILKNYCKEPIIDKYIEGELREDGTRWPGHRGYYHPDNLEKQLIDLIPDAGFDKSEVAKTVQAKFFEFLDMAGNFYNWNGELNSFNMSVCLCLDPNSNKEAVIENWKKYRNKDISIDENKLKKEYYGEEC